MLVIFTLGAPRKPGIREVAGLSAAARERFRAGLAAIGALVTAGGIWLKVEVFATSGAHPESAGRDPRQAGADRNGTACLISGGNSRMPRPIWSLEN